VYAIKELLGDALTALVGSRRARQAAVLDCWEQVVGEARARHARALGLRGGALIVATDLPAVYHELGLRRHALVEALNARAGGNAISEIELIMRPIGRSDPPGDHSQDPRGR
jgi:predicted nucleic acid-binding Zn ribbon protein